jgi:hypothetical protein
MSPELVIIRLDLTHLRVSLDPTCVSTWYMVEMEIECYESLSDEVKKKERHFVTSSASKSF